MGRIKPLTIKRTAKKLLEEKFDLFANTFEENKRIVSQLVECDKRTRNRLAGYITKLKKKMLSDSLEMKNKSVDIGGEK